MHRPSDLHKYCKSEIELLGQEKVMEGTVAEETLVERPLVEKSAN